MLARFGAVPLLLALLGLPACGRSVNVKEAVQLVDATGGWYDAGVVEGKNKIVPAVTFRLKKAADADLSALAVNVAFRHPAPEGSNVEEDWDDVFIQRVAFNGDVTEPLTIRSDKGYTGDPPQSRADLLRHGSFRDLRARIFAKYASAQWVEVGVIDLPRQILVR
jgi:hypothetical protein